MANSIAVASQNVIKMYSQPSDHAEMVSQALLGENLRVLQEDGDWAQIETPDTYTGWTLRQNITLIDDGACYPIPERAAMVAPLFLPVFYAPSALSERLTLLTLGTPVELGAGEAIGPYYPIRLPSGATGFLEGGALIIPHYPPADQLGPNLVVVAKGLIGIPYLWGGRSAFGMDCSGFTQRVYGLCGRRIPRDAYQQADWDGFVPVERDALMGGDLLFFKSDSDPKKRGITHVGMALGDGRFIHASSSHGCITISPVDMEYVSQNFVAGRRMDIAKTTG